MPRGYVPSRRSLRPWKLQVAQLYEKSILLAKINDTEYKQDALHGLECLLVECVVKEEGDYKSYKRKLRTKTGRKRLHDAMKRMQELGIKE